MAANRKDAKTAERGVSLEHRHFAFIAATTAKATFHGFTREDQRKIADMFAHECSKTNPRFNRARFLAACGVSS